MLGGCRVGYVALYCRDHRKEDGSVPHCILFITCSIIKYNQVILFPGVTYRVLAGIGESGGTGEARVKTTKGGEPRLYRTIARENR